VPIGAGDEYLATMALGRAPGAPRWIASEINAASMVAAELARLLLEARLAERQQALNAELLAINDYRRDMVNTLAHELRNPVSVLWTHLDLLGQDAASSIERDSLDAMDRAARRIEDMIEALMALATASDPDRAITRAPVDVSSVVRECCDFLTSVAAHAGVGLHASVGEGLVVLGEEAGIQRMVANLLSNAVKYSPEGGRVTVVLEAAPGADGDHRVEGIRLTCADTGIGIGEVDLSHVFTPFFRAGDPEARKLPGTGLGLSIVESVVKGHGGMIEVASELGVGTTFDVWLPAAPVDRR
jgi:signal transduction histidine kinase